jgi:predicted RNA-binding protein (virulence factor B family)
MENSSPIQVQIGRYNTLHVVKFVDFGLYLDGGDAGEILMPLQYIPENVEVEDEIEVFIYRDSEDRIIATTLHPEAIVGEFAYLEAKEVTPIGAFFEWGLPKDLLVPFREQKKPIEAGRFYLVYIFLDEQTQRITGSTRIDHYLIGNEVVEEEAEAVDLLIAEQTDLGYKTIINNKHWGVLYANEVFAPIHLGDRVTGYIKKIRTDGKIDVCLQKQGYDEVSTARLKLLGELKIEGGFLPLTDKSEPQVIHDAVGMSKKTFKKAVGALYRERLITLEADGIRLVK